MGVLSAFSVVIIVAALGILFKLADRIEEENRMLESGLETSRIYNQMLYKKIDEIRKFRHDSAGLLQTIDIYRLDEDKDMPVYKVGHVTGEDAKRSSMPLLEAIIELKRKQCRENGIPFDCPDHYPDTKADQPDETDLCLLVQNLLDNAYEANLRITDPGKRSMSLEVREEDSCGEWLEIIVSNSIDESEKVAFFTYKPKPELHGIGLRIVDDILKKYNGRRTVREDIEHHMFTTTIRIFPVNSKPEHAM